MYGTPHSALLHQFQHLIALRAGLQVPERGGADLRDALSARMERLGLSSPSDYYRLLSAREPEGPDKPIQNSTSKVQSSEEWHELITLLTRRESHFFRDRGQLALLRDRILPELIKRNTAQRRLRLWSAGCWTGEEAYSLAILVAELLPDWKEWEILILGTDIDAEALRQARRGVYSLWAFQMVQPGLWQPYLREVESGCELAPAIREMVTWRCGNLVKDPYPATGSEIHSMDLILCRNVFLWLSRAEVAAALPKLLEALQPGGFLLTGPGELRDHDLGSLGVLLFPEGLIYQTRSQKGSGSGTPSREAPLVKVERLYHAGAYTEAIAILEGLLETGPESYTLLYLSALVYLKAGQVERAESLCRKALKLEPFAVFPYLILGRAAAARGDWGSARRLFQKAISLAPTCIAAYLDLAVMEEQEGDQVQARRWVAAAVNLLQSMPSGEPLDPYSEETVGQVLRRQKRLCSRATGQSVNEPID